MTKIKTNSSNIEPKAFTLLELMVVIGVIILVSAFVVPAFTNLKSSGDVNSAVYNIGGVLEQARSYAMANRTYVWVGIEEVDASKDPSVNPQTIGIGRIAIAIVASRDGTRGYDITNNSLPNPAWTSYNNGANLVAIDKLVRFENLHMAPFFSTIPNGGNTTRPTVSSGSYQLGNTTANPNPGSCITRFDWPLGSAIGTGQYSFTRVINFDPQGVARIQYTNNTDQIAAYMELGLQQTHGTAVSSSSNVAALQIDCMTGSVRKYRP